MLEEARIALEETVGVPLPAAFANIPGGINVGQALFEEIKQELNKFEVKEQAADDVFNELSVSIIVFSISGITLTSNP